MMSKSEGISRRASTWKKRQQFFNLYAKNLQAVKQHPRIHIEPDIDDIFICPLCFCYFTREEALAIEEDSLVTIEHIPPEALGGKRRTLTCKACNNFAGYELDSHLVNSLEVADFLAGVPGASVDAKFKLNDDIKLAGTAIHGGSQMIELRYDSKRSDPKELEKLSLLGENTPQSINFTFHGGKGHVHKQRRPECSLLRSAYLWAFSVFGYGFLINDNLAVIRSQIKLPTENVLPHWGVSQRSDFPDQSLGINIITSPPELRSFLVVFDVHTKLRSVRYGVVVPGPGSPGLQVYNHIKTSGISRAELPIRFTPIPERKEYLENPDLYFASQIIWKDWINP